MAPLLHIYKVPKKLFQILTVFDESYLYKAFKNIKRMSFQALTKSQSVTLPGRENPTRAALALLNAKFWGGEGGENTK